MKYWQIGNEVGGKEYDASFAAFAKAMRKADPSIKILAAFASDELVQDAPPSGSTSSARTTTPAPTCEATEADIQRHAEIIERLARGRPIKMAVTEWNTTAGDWGPDRHRLWTLQNGLACARYLNLCHRCSDLVKIACRSNISNSYCSGIIQTNHHTLYGTPAYHVSRLYAEHGGAHPLELGAATAASGPRRLRQPECRRQAAFALRGQSGEGADHEDRWTSPALGKVASTARVWTIADADDARDPEATNSFARPERIATRATTISNAGRRFSYRFPAFSVTLMELGIESRE